MTTVRADTAAALRRVAVARQVSARVPGLRVGVVRDGALAWSDGVGRADLTAASPPEDDTRFEIASITKTFTAVVVMALRDEGRLSLDDTVERFVPESVHHGITIRMLLAHLAGMQREPVEGVYETMVFPDRGQLVASWNAAEVVLRPHYRWHYSNLCYGLLGEIVTRLEGRSWLESVRSRILEPLEMGRTTLAWSVDDVATGYFVPPDVDVPVLEPKVDFAAMSPVGGLCSTVADLARWASFWVDPVAEVLDPASVEEMVQPQTMSDTRSWKAGYGLGLQLFRHDEQVFVGHTGGNPGFVSGLFVHRESGVGGIVLTNSSSGTEPAAFAIELARTLLEKEPAEPTPWTPGTAVPEGLRDLLGAWYSEGSEMRISVAGGRLQARAAMSPAWVPPSVFTEIGPDRYRTESGRETGELLTVTRDEQGRVLKLNWATYLLTREPIAFGDWPTGSR